MPDAKTEVKTLDELARQRVAAQLEADRLIEEAERLHSEALDLELDGKSADARKVEAKAGDLRLKAGAQERLAERLDYEMRARAEQDLAGLAEKAKTSAAALDAHREKIAAGVVLHLFGLLHLLHQWRPNLVMAAPPAPEELRADDLTARNGHRISLLALLRTVAGESSGRFLTELHVSQLPEAEYSKILRDIFPGGYSPEALRALGDKARELKEAASKCATRAQRGTVAELLDFALRSARSDAGLANGEAGEVEAPQTSAEPVAGD